MRLFPALCTLFLAAVSMGLAHAAPREAVMLKPTAFEDGLPGWEHRGEAEFVCDPGQPHGGHASVRITVAAGAKLEFQQLRCSFTQDVQPGDRLRASAWMRSRGELALPGAYLALEFVGASGERVGIAHSRPGAGLRGKGWERLVAEGTAPQGTHAARFSLVLHAEGTAWFAEPEVASTDRLEPWPDLGDATRHVTIRTDEIVQPNFGGVGFHAIQQSFAWSRDEWDNVIYKKWRELRPSFARLNHSQEWDQTKLDDVANHILRMKEVGTEIYITTLDPPVLKTDPERREYAKRIVGQLEYLVRRKGCTNIRYYCISGELGLAWQWAVMMDDLPAFKAYTQAFFDELKARDLDIKLLATDASPASYWDSVEWAAQNMDDITGIYGGHHYFSEHPLDDERMYPWFLEKARWAVGVARAKGKEFILGEFGPRPDGRTIDGVKNDSYADFDTPQEPMVGIQAPEAAIAAINGGVYAMGYWTFMDLPDQMSKAYINKCGLFRASGPDHSTRSLYYAYGLLSKFFRGPATVYTVETNDPRLRVAAIQHRGTARGAGVSPAGGGQTWSIAIINRNKRSVPLQIATRGTRGDAPRGAAVPAAIPPAAMFRKYTYDPASPPMNPCGDLQGPAGKVALKAGKLADTLGPMSLTVYTTDYDEAPPAPVKGVKVERTPEAKTVIRWQANKEPDLCYYRVFRNGTRIGSTVAVQFTDPTGEANAKYTVVAVDSSGNASAKQ